MRQFKWVVAVLVIIGVVFAGLKMYRLKNQLGYTPARSVVDNIPMNIKANGKISIIDGKIVLTTPSGLNNYMISGTMSADIEKQANNTIYVFGKLINPAVSKINNMAIRAGIDVTQFDKKDFTVGKPVSKEQFEAFKNKVYEKVAFRNKVLKKLKLEKSDYEVISGKLSIVKAFYLREKAKERPALFVTDKYGDKYVVFAKLKYPIEDFAKLDGMNLDVVVVGYVVIPDLGITVVVPTGPPMTFNAPLGVFNNDAELTELIPNK